MNPMSFHFVKSTLPPDEPKIMLGRVVRSVSAAPTPENIRGAVEHLHSIYEKNEANPAVKEDLKTIFG